MTNLFIDLKKEYEEKGHIPYAEFLNTQEWHEKREKILKRDNYKCRQCSLEENRNLIPIDWDDKGTRYYVKGKWISEENYLDWRKHSKDSPFTALHVHHLRYYKNRLPWDYSDSELISLCADCHKKTHENEIIPVFKEKDGSLLELKPCPRCLGMGYLPEYLHVQGGICFKCRGERYMERIIDNC